MTQHARAKTPEAGGKPLPGKNRRHAETDIGSQKEGQSPKKEASIMTHVLHARMRHYVSRGPGRRTVHVQNMLVGLTGQHHVHSPAQFRRWQRTVQPGEAELLHVRGICRCGLRAGEVTGS